MTTLAAPQSRLGVLRLPRYATYVRYELVRTLRNKRFFIFSLAFPLVFYLVFAGANHHELVSGTRIPFTLYYMAGMVSWGAMAAIISGGARIAAERAIGWVRQLRISPLSVRVYLGAKVLTGYLAALLTIALLYVAGTAYGVRLPWDAWLRMTFLLLVGLVPFAAIGVLFGLILSVDSLGPALGGATSLFAFLGGAWYPIGDGVMRHIAELIPSYWMVQAGHSAFTGEWWPAKAWVVIAIWTVAMVRLAQLAYQRDAHRS